MLIEGINREIYNFLEQDADLLIIRSPAGFGKTRTALYYSLAQALKGKRVVNFYRTIEEIGYALRILTEIKREKDEVLIIPLVGKEHMCRFVPDSRDLLRWWCIFLNCNFLKRRRNSDLENHLRKKVYPSIKDYYKIARDEDLCPYFFYQDLSDKAGIILTTHKYFIDDKQFEKLGQVDIAIVDEAHNIFIIKTAEIDKHSKEVGERLFNIAEDRALREDRFAKKIWFDGDKNSVLALARYVNYREADGLEIEHGEKYIKIVTPSTLYRKRKEDIDKIILMSGTMYPITLYKEIIKTENFNTKTLIQKGMINETKNRKILALTIGLTTRFKERSMDMLKKYAQVINRLNIEIEKPLIVFTPNKEMAKSLADLLKGIYIERTFENLEKISGDCSEIIFITYMRGPLSEGVELDLGKCNPNIEIIIGLPYPMIDSETQKIFEVYSKILNLPERQLIEAYKTSEMISTLIQTAGRVGRADKGIVVIIDDRLKSLPLGIKYINNIELLIEIMNKFLQ